MLHVHWVHQVFVPMVWIVHLCDGESFTPHRAGTNACRPLQSFALLRGSLLRKPPHHMPVLLLQDQKGYQGGMWNSFDDVMEIYCKKHSVRIPLSWPAAVTS